MRDPEEIVADRACEDLFREWCAEKQQDPPPEAWAPAWRTACVKLGQPDLQDQADDFADDGAKYGALLMTMAAGRLRSRLNQRKPLRTAP